MRERTPGPGPPRGRHDGGKGGVLRLRYHVRGLAGGRVPFVETVRGIRHVIGATARARGTLRFRPARATAVRRRIVATVVRDGTPEPVRRVARFRARTRHAAPPRRVRVHARGPRRVITWTVRALDRRGRAGRARSAWSPPRRTATPRIPARCTRATC